MTENLSVETERLLGPLNDIERKHCPSGLFVAGDTSLLNGSLRVSIVGSREASELGLRRAARLARELVAADVVVVSGLAKGIDRAAHLAAMQAGGRTIAVIGTPLHQVYPKEHAALQDQIAREHLLVSEFPEGATIGKWAFPKRNRTMALLSHATVIVEAGEKSGVISQGWEAHRLGRPLFLMKSLLDAKLGWPQEFLDYGAHVLSSTEELLSWLPSKEPLSADAL